MLSESRPCRRLHDLTPLFEVLFRTWAEAFQGENASGDSTDTYLVDSFPVPVCRNSRIRRCRLYPSRWLPPSLHEAWLAEDFVQVAALAGLDQKDVRHAIAPSRRRDAISNWFIWQTRCAFVGANLRAWVSTERLTRSTSAFTVPSPSGGRSGWGWKMPRTPWKLLAPLPRNPLLRLPRRGRKPLRVRF
jgi:hypothetical protein